MNKEELKKFIENNKDNYSIQLKRHHPFIYDEIDKLYTFDKFGQKLYHFINGDINGKCEICGGTCKFDGIHKGYRKRCSYKCLSENRHRMSNEKRNCIICNKEFEIYKNRVKTTCSKQCLLKLNSSDEVNKKRTNSLRESMMKKYGVSHPSHMEDFAQKVKETKFKNHGNENYVNLEKSKQTKLEKYGDKNYVNVNKIKQTKSAKYGDENYNNRTLAKKTLIERFGTPYSPNMVCEAKKNIILGRIGFGSEIFRKTMLELYGTIHCNQNKNIISKSKCTRYTNFLTETFFEKIKNIAEPLFNIDIYRGTKTGGCGIQYPFKCKTCNCIFDDIISNGKVPQCPTCYPICRSKSQKEIIEFLENILPPEINIIENTKSVISPLELDIFIPKLNIAIEFDGLFWHSESGGGKNKKYHLNKTEECKNKGIRLIHIFEDEWSNKKDIIKNKLKHILGYNTNEKIYARKCKINVISIASEKANFLNEFHLQGNDSSGIWIGAYYNEILIALMTFGKVRIALGNRKKYDNEYEMYRFCTNGIKTNGIASKLLSYFIKTYKPEKIISYADRRWSSGNLYEKIGFKKVSDGTPNYWYIKNNRRYHRFVFRKSELSRKLSVFDPELTEWENMQINRYDRIWDCGSLKYEWISPQNQV